MAGQILSGPLTRVVVSALVVLVLARLVPLGAVQFYVQALAGLVALWPLAYQSRVDQLPLWCCSENLPNGPKSGAKSVTAPAKLIDSLP